MNCRSRGTTSANCIDCPVDLTFFLMTAIKDGYEGTNLPSRLFVDADDVCRVPVRGRRLDFAADQTVEFELYGAQLTDGTYVTGTFTYDFTHNAATAIDIVAEGMTFDLSNSRVSKLNILDPISRALAIRPFRLI